MIRFLSSFPAMCCQFRNYIETVDMNVRLMGLIK